MYLACVDDHLGYFEVLALFSSVQSHSHVWLFATPWITARQASLSITNSQSSRKLMSIELVMPSSHLILCRPLLLQSLPASESFPMSQLFASGGQSTGVSAVASFLPKNTQGWSLEWTGWISFPTIVVTFCNIWKFQLLHILTIVSLLNFSHAGGWLMISQGGFKFIFP